MSNENLVMIKEVVINGGSDKEVLIEKEVINLCKLIQLLFASSKMTRAYCFH